jgi:rhodanese-related sulfurtransferase
VFGRTSAHRVSADELEAARADGAQVIDVREIHEWRAGRLPFAVHIPLGELADRVSEIDQERPIIFVCRSGQRSGAATDAFVRANYRAANLVGGMKACRAAGARIVREDGAPGDVI